MLMLMNILERHLTAGMRSKLEIHHISDAI